MILFIIKQVFLQLEFRIEVRTCLKLVFSHYCIFLAVFSVRQTTDSESLRLLVKLCFIFFFLFIYIYIYFLWMPSVFFEIKKQNIFYVSLIIRWFVFLLNCMRRTFDHFRGGSVCWEKNVKMRGKMNMDTSF